MQRRARLRAFGTPTHLQSYSDTLQEKKRTKRISEIGYDTTPSPLIGLALVEK